MDQLRSTRMDDRNGRSRRIPITLFVVAGLIVALVTLLVTSSQMHTIGKATGMAPPAGYAAAQLIFDDHFTGTSLNSARWNTAIGGQGDPAKLAKVVRDALAETTTPFEASPTPAGEPPKISFDTAQVDEALGFQGRNNGGVYQFSIPRADTLKAGGMTVAPAMGTANAINFEPTGDGKAAITGDFVALAKEVEPLLKVLRSNGIEVTALHNHMLDDEPRLFFVHFWANDDAVKLAHALRASLDAVHVAAGR